MYRLADLDPQHPPPLVPGDDPDAWRKNRARILEVWREYLGVLPEPVEVSWRIRAEHRIEPTPTEPAVTLLHIDYDAPGKQARSHRTRHRAPPHPRLRP